MRIRLDYGAEGLEVEVPDDATIIEPEFRAPLTDPLAALTTSLRSPLGRQPLRELVHGDQHVAISICDGTRPQPRREMLGAVLGELTHVPAGQILILVATGTHRGNTRPELEAMLGADLLARYRVV